MTDTITVTPQSDLSGIRLTQSKTGHVHSPKFTFPNEVTRTVRGPEYHWFIGHSIHAFMGLLGIDRDEVIVTEHHDKATDERWWSLGTKHPCALPKPPAKKLPEGVSNAGVIDI